LPAESLERIAMRFKELDPNNAAMMTAVAVVRNHLFNST
jgi:hypothetical protein